jgi:diguanylate cyclase (GGDEF)-like protein
MQVIGGVVCILVLQRIGFLFLGTGPGGRLFLDVFIVLASSLAIGSCFAAAMRGRGVSRIFWLLFASSFAMQLIADASWAYFHYFHVAVPDGAIFPSLFYRLYAGPIAIALFLSDDSSSSKFESFLDGSIVVGLVGLTMYQVQMAEHAAQDSRIWQLITATALVNAILVLAAAARYFLSPRGTLHGLFKRQTIYLLTYSSVAFLTSTVDAYFPAIDDSFDLIWIVIYLAGAVLALTWEPPAEEQAITRRISRRAALLCFNLTLAAMVLGSAILGFRVIDSTRIVGLLATSVVLFSYAVRCSLMQDNQEKYLTALHESRAQLQHQALYDELTGLPNRRLFAERLSQTLAMAQREGHVVALLYFDFDGFKPINDRHGHSVGDLLLKHAAAHMLTRVRKSDTLARMGGDEFTLLVSHLPDKEHAALVARELLRTISEPFDIEGHSIAITASIGIGVFPEGATDSAGLIHQADSAMYAVKRDGKDGVRYYTPDLG